MALNCEDDWLEDVISTEEVRLGWGVTELEKDSDDRTLDTELEYWLVWIELSVSEAELDIADTGVELYIADI